MNIIEISKRLDQCGKYYDCEHCEYVEAEVYCKDALIEAMAEEIRKYVAETENDLK